MLKSEAERLDTRMTSEPAREKRTRRAINAEHKLCMIAEAEACQHSKLGLLCREKLYSHQLSEWRREFAEHGVIGLSKSAHGPTAARTPDQRRIDQLEKDNRRLNRKLVMAYDCLDLPKKPFRCSID